jgi:hypothetical protein
MTQTPSAAPAAGDSGYSSESLPIPERKTPSSSEAPRPAPRPPLPRRNGPRGREPSESLPSESRRYQSKRGFPCLRWLFDAAQASGSRLAQLLARTLPRSPGPARCNQSGHLEPRRATPVGRRRPIPAQDRNRLPQDRRRQSCRQPEQPASRGSCCLGGRRQRWRRRVDFVESGGTDAGTAAWRAAFGPLGLHPRTCSVRVPLRLATESYE